MAYQQQAPYQQHGPYEQQPQQHPQMQHQYAPVQTGQGPHGQGWQHGLMSCGPCDLCMLGTCCPCILVGKTSARMRDPSMQTYDTCNSDCMLMFGINFCTGCGWIYAMIKRTEIREKYGIKGDGTGDCCATYWCACCALIQQEKEVRARAAPGLVTQAYHAPTGKDGMHMPQ